MANDQHRAHRIQPMTALLALSSIAVTIWWWMGGDPTVFTLDIRVWQEPWRLISSVFPHVDVIHLVFNIYWLGIFGGRIEAEFGSVKTALLFLFLGVGSSLAQFTLSDSGVGLSGIGYGLFGFLWVLGRHDIRFAGAVSSQVVRLFVGWFFLCIALTVAEIWHVGNIAHGAGALLGGLSGWCVSTQGSERHIASRSLLFAASVMILIAAVVGRPYLNRSGIVAHEFSYLGHQALIKGDAIRAASLLEQSIELDPSVSANWYNLGIAYQRLGRLGDAKTAYERAVQLSPDDEDYVSALQGL